MFFSKTIKFTWMAKKHQGVTLFHKLGRIVHNNGEIDVDIVYMK